MSCDVISRNLGTRVPAGQKKQSAWRMSTVSSEGPGHCQGQGGTSTVRLLLPSLGGFFFLSSILKLWLTKSKNGSDQNGQWQRSASSNHFSRSILNQSIEAGWIGAKDGRQATSRKKLINV